MSAHAFIFKPGVWEGRGIITFSMAEDRLEYTTRWTVLPKEGEEIFMHQEVSVRDFAEKTRNQFCISKIGSETFDILLENHLVGKVVGKGIFSEETIAWEFRKPNQGFEGFEIYKLQEDGSYHVRAEFTAGPGLRTFIKGSIGRMKDKG